MGNYSREVLHLYYWMAFMMETACEHLERYALYIDDMVEDDHRRTDLGPPDETLDEEAAMVHRLLDRANVLRDQIYDADIIPPRIQCVRGAEYLYLRNEATPGADPEWDVQHVPMAFVRSEGEVLGPAYRLRELLTGCGAAAHTPQRQILETALQVTDLMTDIEREYREEHLIRFDNGLFPR